jgi:hypothetical protein
VFGKQLKFRFSIKDSTLETFLSVTGLIFNTASGTVNQMEKYISNLLMDIRHANFKICLVLLFVAFSVKGVKVAKKNLHLTRRVAVTSVTVYGNVRSLSFVLVTHQHILTMEEGKSSPEKILPPPQNIFGVNQFVVQ